jgi:hypothetical protein
MQIQSGNRDTSHFACANEIYKNKRPPQSDKRTLSFLVAGIGCDGASLLILQQMGILRQPVLRDEHETWRNDNW